MQTNPARPADRQTSTDFSHLIERIKDGDERALEKLLAAFAIPLRRMATQYIGRSLQPHLDADDLIQRVSMILWRGLREGKFELAEPKQLTSLAKTLLRRQAARAVQRLGPALKLGAAYEGDLSATPMIQANGVAEKAERADQIRDLMNRVHGVDRWMLKLLMEGHSIAGTARLLGAEPTALRMRLSRLRVRLRRVILQPES